MSVWELVSIAIGLSMDAFAVSICKGVSIPKMSWKKALLVGLFFGVFQAVMPLIGYFIGSQFAHLIQDVDHWIAFVLLVLLGIKMLKGDHEEEKVDDSFSFKTLTLLAIATSIDALAVGITFSFLQISIWLAITLIGVITFVFCIIGVKIGNAFGSRFKTTAERIGGIILILMGLKILLEHLQVF